MSRFHLFARDVQTESRRTKGSADRPIDPHLIRESRDAVITLVDARGEIETDT